jgi:hypothetical protein
MTTVAIPDINELIMNKMKLNGTYSPAQKGALVHACVNKLCEDAACIEMGWMRLGATYHFLRINKLWSSYVSHIKNARDFLKEIDLGVTQRSLEYYASIIDSKLGDYIIQSKCLLPMTKLRAIATVVKDTGKIEEWVTKAKSLPQKALEDEVRESRGKRASDVCEHPAGSLIRYLHCEKCNKWIKAE